MTPTLLLAATEGSGSQGVSLSLAIIAIIGLAVAAIRLSNAVGRLEKRLETLESRAASAPVAAPPAANAVAAPQAAAPALAPAVAPATTAASQPAVTAPASEVTPEDFAIIAAAVTTLLGRSARVVQVSPADGHNVAWSIEGRRSIYQSHMVRR